MNSIKLQNRMYTISIISKNNKTSKPRPLHNLTDKVNSKRRDKYVALSNISVQYRWKNLKKK